MAAASPDGAAVANKGDARVRELRAAIVEVQVELDAQFQSEISDLAKIRELAKKLKRLKDELEDICPEQALEESAMKIQKALRGKNNRK
mmetsp:Transcript_137214/g.437791  ORF Transcript_137214/g.437791 Transcript_137214/m.437791 type:complete len:89 (-) Transcript_137214:318-584(-)